LSSKLGAAEKDVLNEQLDIIVAQEKELKTKNTAIREKAEALFRELSLFDEQLLTAKKGMYVFEPFLFPPPGFQHLPYFDQ